MGAVWTDPDFDPKQSAFYYARVIEIPTPRWIVYDAFRFGIEIPDPPGARLHGAHLAYALISGLDNEKGPDTLRIRPLLLQEIKVP